MAKKLPDITLIKLMQESDRLRKEGSLYVQVKSLKKKEKDGLRSYVCTTSSTHDANGEPNKVGDRHRTEIAELVRAKSIGSSVCKVQCSCHDFTFAGYEYANAKKGISDIIYGNGQPPEIKQVKPWKIGMCKHLYALGDALRRGLA